MDKLLNIGGKDGAEMNKMMEGMPDDMAKKAGNLWKFLDDLAANDPEGYKKFLDEQGQAAEAAKKEEEEASPVEGAAPLALVEAGMIGKDVPEGSFALLHLWRGKSGMPEGTVGGGKPINPGTTSWAGASIPMSHFKKESITPMKKGELQMPGQQDLGEKSTAALHHYHIIVGPATLALVASGKPPELRALLINAACQFVEKKYPVELSRTQQMLKVDSAVMPKKAPDVKAAANLAAQGTAAARLSQGLLGELASLGIAEGGQSKGAQAGDSLGGLFGGGKPAPKPKAPLIQEISSQPAPSTDKEVSSGADVSDPGGGGDGAVTFGPGLPKASTSRDIASGPPAVGPSTAGGSQSSDPVQGVAVPGSAPEASPSPAPSAVESTRLEWTPPTGRAYLLQVQASKSVRGSESLVVEACFPQATHAGEIGVQIEEAQSVLMTLDVSVGSPDPPLVARLPRQMTEGFKVAAKFDKKTKVLRITFRKIAKKTVV
eukprot:gene11115-18737_t